MLPLRDYQFAAADSYFQQIALGKRSPLVVAATGLGKTVLAAEIINRRLESDPRPVLFLAHVETLLDQAAKTFRQQMPLARVGWEVQGKQSYANDQIVFGMVQCMNRRLERVQENNYSLIVVDESHHSRSDTYETVLKGVTKPTTLLLGLTATPKRLDGAALDRVFDCVAADYSIVWGEENGWLVPMRQRVVDCKAMDLSKIKTVAGDFNSKQLNKQLMKQEVMKLMCDHSMRAAEGRQTLVFCSSIEQADAMASILRGRGVKAESIHSKSKTDPKTVIDRYKRLDLNVLLSVSALGEGFDCPDAEVCVKARPTASQTICIQQVGRVLRPVKPPRIDATAEERRAEIKASAKPYALVIDFVGNLGRHRLVMSGDVLKGTYTDEEHALAQKIAMKHGGDVDMTELLELAKKRIKAHRDKKRGSATHSYIDKRREHEAKHEDTDPGLFKGQGYRLMPGDWPRVRAWVPCPFLILKIDADLVQQKYKSGLRRDAAETLNVLRKGRLEDKDFDHLDKFAKEVLADVLEWRFRRNMGRYRQVESLFKNGYYKAREWSFEKCQQCLTRLQKNEWARPLEDGPYQFYDKFIEVVRKGTVSYADGSQTITARNSHG